MNSEPIPRKLVYIFIYTQEPKVFLQDRRSISKFGEEWGAFGGSIEEGETPDAAVVRETKEELNFNLENPFYLGRFEEVHPLGDLILDVEVDVYLHPLTVPESEIVDLEGDGAKLFTREEALSLKLVSDLEYGIVEKVFDYLTTEQKRGSLLQE